MNITKRLQKGFTLTELLVSVLVFSIGLLGIAGLQAVSLRNNTSSMMRTQAMLVAYDIADRMRNNTSGVIDGNYDSIDLAQEHDCSNGCNPQSLAAADLHRLLDTVETRFPDGVVEISRSDQAITLIITWLDDIRRNKSTSFRLDFSV